MQRPSPLISGRPLSDVLLVDTDVVMPDDYALYRVHRSVREVHPQVNPFVLDSLP